jgi:uncharacterized membrane protein
MTVSVTELTVTAEDRRVAWLATAAVALSLVDAAIPSPLPGVKPGLANIVTLVVLARYGWATSSTFIWRKFAPMEVMTSWYASIIQASSAISRSSSRSPAEHAL